MTREINLPLTCRDIKMMFFLVWPVLMIYGFLADNNSAIGFGIGGTIVVGWSLGLLFILENGMPFSIKCRCDNE